MLMAKEQLAARRRGMAQASHEPRSSGKAYGLIKGPNSDREYPPRSPKIEKENANPMNL